MAKKLKYWNVYQLETDAIQSRDLISNSSKRTLLLWIAKTVEKGDVCYSKVHNLLQ